MKESYHTVRVFGKIYNKKDRGTRNFWSKTNDFQEEGRMIFRKIFIPVYFNNNTVILIFNALGEKRILNIRKIETYYLYILIQKYNP